jgi:transcriptional regulator with XRE-family HTH domain
MEHPRIGRIVRALRHRRSLRQRDVADAAATTQSTISLVERGHLEMVSLPALRRVMRVLDADLVLVVRWRGGEIDRLLDERHAGLGEAVTRLLAEDGWEALPEVTYSIFGERGSIDILAWHPASRTLLVIELKSELTSIEETFRRHDVKVRLAARIALEQFGWRPATVGRLLVLPEGRTARRHVERHSALFAKTYPERNVAVRAFLRRPAERSGSARFGGLMFLSSIDQGSGVRVSGPRRRVRRSVDA